MNSIWIKNLTILSLSTILHGCAISGNQLEEQLASDRRPQASLSLVQTPICCQTLRQITYIPLTQEKINIDDHSPVMAFSGNKSFFYAAAIRDNQRSNGLIIRSLIGKTAFPIQLQLLNANFQPTRTIPFSDFELTEASLLYDPSLKTQINLLPEESYIIIYADIHLLDKTIGIPHPEQLKEKATGVKALSYPDLAIPFSPWGLIDIQIINQNNQLKNLLNTNTPLIETSHTASTLSSQMPTINEQPTTISGQTKQYYKQAIEQAVADNQVEKAMQLVSEGKKLGFTEAEQIFINAVKQK